MLPGYRSYVRGDSPVSVDDQGHIHLGQVIAVTVMTVFEERDGRGVG